VIETPLELMVKLCKEFEGCELEAYRDPVGIWTIGYGHTGPDVFEHLMWSQEHADEVLAKDCQHHMQGALYFSPGLRQESPYKQAAIADFVFNLGATAYSRSTLKKRVDDKNWASAIKEIKRWNKAGGKVLKGLTRRRQREAEYLAR